MIGCLDCGKSFDDKHIHIGVAVGETKDTGHIINKWGCGCEALNLSHRTENWSWRRCEYHQKIQDQQAGEENK